MPRRGIGSMYALPKKRIPDVYETVKYGRMLRYRLKVLGHTNPTVYVYKTPDGYFTSMRDFRSKKDVTLVGQIYAKGAVIHGVSYIPHKGVILCGHDRTETCPRCDAWKKNDARRKKRKDKQEIV